MTYWAYFDLNGLSFISLSDIIKSSVQPIIITALSSLVGLYFAHVGYKNSTKKYRNNDDNGTLSRKGVLIFIPIFIVIIFVLYLIYRFIPEQRYYIIGFLFANLFAILIPVDKIFDKSFNTYFDKELLFTALLYFPVFAFATASQNAEKILNNQSYRYSINEKIVAPKNILINDTIKLVGQTDNNFIFTDLKNSKIIFLKKDSIVLYKK